MYPHFISKNAKSVVFVDKIIFSNGIPACQRDGNNGYWVKYTGDSLHYFNNQPPVKTRIFDYYAIDETGNFDGSIDPIRFSISSIDGMMLSMEYFYTTRSNQIFVGRKKVQDYRKVLFKKSRVLRCLM